MRTGTARNAKLWAMSFLLIGTPQLLVLSMFGVDSAALAPTDSILSAPERVVVWNALLLGVELIVLAVITPFASEGLGDTKQVTPDEGL